MKTITNGVIVKRVDDITAQENVKKGWRYCPKSSWKTLLRANTASSGLVGTKPLEDSPLETGICRGAVVKPPTSR